LNHRRCLRLLGQWAVPDRSSDVSQQQPAFENHPIRTEDRLSASLGAFAKTKRSVKSIDDWRWRGQLREMDSPL
jgi:hypothetical protein